MKKPIIYRIFGGYTITENILINNGFKFTSTDIFSNFWGKEYTIEAPSGKGSSTKLKTLFKLLKI